MKRPRAIINVPASVRQRLYNRARAQGDDFNLILSRYAIERLLYRLSKSQYAGEFVLKGAQLFYVWIAAPHRTTRDLDLLRYGAAALSELETMFRNICGQPVAELDGIEFLAETVRGEEIREQAEYRGARIRFAYRLGEAKGALQIDIGFGDVATPAPKFVNFPSLLDFPAPRLKAYQRETVVAEKFHALVALGINNSRFKDFYDLFVLAKTFQFDGKPLSGAIQATFKRRKTALSTETPIALSAAFAKDPNKQKQWRAFLMKNRVELARIDFVRVVETIRKFLLPPTMALVQGQKFKYVWEPGGPWREEEHRI